ncbi:MAG: cytochrome c oxidase subunit II [Caldimonas sp.]
MTTGLAAGTAGVALPAVAGASAPPALPMSPLPMSYLTTFGPAGDPVTRLGWGLGLVSIVVVVLVAVLLLWGLLKRRATPTDASALTVTRDAGGMSWIVIGVGFSSIVLVGCAVWTMFTVAAVAMPARASDLVVQVDAAQWWWSVRYLDPDPSRIFTTANEIHVPTGRPVRFELRSSDVIHSFWIPQLGGKMDVIPGQTNVMWLEASRPGVYRGQCGEYCGAQHAHMAMSVVADTPAVYDAWANGQRAAAAQSGDAVASRGQQVFLANCAACHAVRGTGAGGILGPDLTHLASRATIGAGLLPNSPGNLSAWIANSQALKPGSRMPSLTLSGPDLNAVVSWLGGLK